MARGRNKTPLEAQHIADSSSVLINHSLGTTCHEMQQWKEMETIGLCWHGHDNRQVGPLYILLFAGMGSVILSSSQDNLATSSPSPWLGWLSYSHSKVPCKQYSILQCPVWCRFVNKIFSNLHEERKWQNTRILQLCKFSEWPLKHWQ